jgi:hypothetical protein
MNLEMAEALWTLGLLREHDMREVGVQAIDDGIENEYLRALAGLTQSELDEAPILFKKAMKALGRGQASKVDAIRSYARQVAGQIVRREIEPYFGAKEIWRAQIDSGLETRELDAFVYAASEYEDRPMERGRFASEIMKEARRFAGGVISDEADNSPSNSRKN